MFGLRNDLCANNNPLIVEWAGKLGPTRAAIPKQRQANATGGSEEAAKYKIA